MNLVVTLHVGDRDGHLRLGHFLLRLHLFLLGHFLVLLDDGRGELQRALQRGRRRRIGLFELFLLHFCGGKLRQSGDLRHLLLGFLLRSDETNDRGKQNHDDRQNGNDQHRLVVASGRVPTHFIGAEVMILAFEN